MPGPVEVVAAGMIWPVLLVDGKYCGPEIEPVGPMIWSTWLGGEGAHLHRPVERHAERARRAVGDQVAVGAVATRHRGAQNLRAGHDQRQSVLIERGTEDARGAEECDRGRRLGRGDRVDVARRRARERRRHRVLVGRAVGILIHRVARPERRADVGLDRRADGKACTVVRSNQIAVGAGVVVCRRTVPSGMGLKVIVNWV